MATMEKRRTVSELRKICVSFLWHRGMKQSDKDYKRAIMVLNSMQEEGIFADFKNKKTKHIDMMKDCLHRINLTMDQIDQLSIIHVAGTKGSTCEYAESLLRHHGYTTGFFSEPHLFDVRERVRINGKLVDKQTFTTAFWHVFDKLHMSKTNNKVLPGYSNMTLLVALHIFVENHVDVLVLEACTVGEYDPTNFIENPVVCGVASLKLRNGDQLGNTIEENSWHTTGIVKKTIPLVTVQHDQESVLNVILNRTKEKKSPLFIAQPVVIQENTERLGSVTGRQAQNAVNAGLALQLCSIWQQRTGKIPDILSRPPPSLEFKVNVNAVGDIPTLASTPLTTKEKEGLQQTRSTRLTKKVRQGRVTYYFDAASTSERLQEGVDWFLKSAQQEKEVLEREPGSRVKRSFVFGTKWNEKVAERLRILNDCREFQSAAFCPHVISTSARETFPDSIELRTDPAKAKEIANEQRTKWMELPMRAPSLCLPSIVSALWWAGGKTIESTTLKQLAENDIQGNLPANPVDRNVRHVQVLVTGHLVVVGGALGLIEPDYWE